MTRYRPALLAKTAFILLGCGLSAIAQNRSPKWVYTTGAPVLSSPALSANGVLYVGSYDEKFHAINSSDGSVRWTFSVKPTRTNQASYVYSTPAIGSDGTIYFGTEERYWLSPASTSGTLYALNPNGTQKWKYSVPASIYSDPAIASDGTVYFGCYDTNLYALNANGTLKWKYPATGYIFSDVAIGGDGAIYFGCDDHHLYALNPNGTLKWKFNTGGPITASPSIASDGTIYVGSTSSQKFYAVNPNGSQRWEFQATGAVSSSAALADDGTIFFGSDDGHLYALNAQGAEIWRFPTGAKVRSSPAIAGDGTVYFGCDDGNLYATSAQGELLWTLTTQDYVYGSPVIGGDGSVYVSSADNAIYAVAGTSGLAQSAWPMFRHDPLHTGRMPAGSSNPVNSAPTLEVIPDYAVNEATILSFTAEATDSDVPAQTLTFSLSGAPQGVTIDSSTGVFSWKPSEAQGPGSYTIAVVVTDSGSPSLSATRSFEVTVHELNQAPLLETIADQSADESSTVMFTAQAADLDLPAQTVSYSLSGAPEGAAINPTTGVFSWAPSEAQGPATYTVAVIAADSGSPILSVTNMVTLLVREVNSPPTLNSIQNVTITSGATHSFTASASDPDLPVNQLTFHLVAGPPGATLDSSTGLFSWTAPAIETNATFAVTIEVKDNATPAAAHRQTFDISVQPVSTPDFVSVEGANGLLILTWSAIPERIYRVQYTDALGSEGGWLNLSGDVQATAETATKQDVISSPNRLYRVVLLD